MKRLVGGACALVVALASAGCENDTSGLNVGPRDISANPGELAFGMLHTDTTATQIVTLKNTGGDDLHVFEMSIEPDIELYRIAGTFFGSPAILKNDTPNLVTEFAANVLVGTSGSASEKGLDGAVAALTFPNISGANAGFLRDDAKLFVVFVSDEEDQSTESVSYYVDLLTAVKDGNTEDLFLAGIVGPPTGTCTGDGTAPAAPRYNEALALTGGLYGSICDADFGLTLQNLAFEITSPTAEFFLSYLPDLATLKVKVDGVQQADDRWSYDPFANSVIFETAFVPVMGADVSIEYSAIDSL